MAVKTTPNYSTRRARELEGRTKPAVVKIIPCPEHAADDVVRFYDGEKSWRLPRLAQVLADPKKYAALVGLKPGAEFDAYVARFRERNPCK